VSGPCEWPVITSGLGPQWEAAEEDEQDNAVAFATYLLWALTGRRFGVCEHTFRPDPAEVRTCDPVRGHILVLPGPVQTVEEVLVDGVELVEVDDWLLYGNDLVRTGGAMWPAANDLTLPSTEEGTWSVTITRGIPVPVAGQVAAGLLARELLPSIVGTTGCRLPSRVQQVSREGVDMSLVDPTALLDSGRTGIREVDMFIAAVNPNRIAAPPVVWSPDVGELRVGGGA
jgi:hypothetical protein